jgi:hypothetical protein
LLYLSGIVDWLEHKRRRGAAKKEEESLMPFDNIKYHDFFIIQKRARLEGKIKRQERH